MVINGSFKEKRPNISLLTNLFQSTLALYLSAISHRVHKLAETATIPIAKCGQLSSEDHQIGKFEYWYDRVVVLKQPFDDAEPRSLLQWWCNRRRLAQWYHFRFAVMLVVGSTCFLDLLIVSREDFRL
jgi:hypothetical protein